MDISIVTPVFNSVRWIDLCLQSVRHALKERNYEHIVVDGGSTDGTLEYLKQHKDIRLIPGPDKGMYDALNKGMATARGRILGHLNADEQYDRAGLAHALQKLDQTGADAVFGPTIMLDEHLSFLYLFNQITVPRPIDADWHMPVQTCSFLFRRQIWERFPYPPKYRVVGDHVWFRRQMKLGLNLVSIRKPIGIFTWHQAPSTGREAQASRDKSSAVPRVSILCE
jgi:glycosyltransferase involved in cell wall biosynthesis